MKIVISALHFEWQDMNDCLSRATVDLGLDGVELSWNRSYKRSHCTQEDIRTLSAARQRGDLALSAHIWENLGQSTFEQGTQDLLDWLRVCRETGTTDLVIHGGSSPDRKEGIAHTRRVLETVLPQFEAAGVVLNLENHYAYDYHDCNELFSEPWEFMEVLSLDSPSLRFCFDTGHGNMTGNPDELVGELAPWLSYVHLADNQGTDDNHDMFREGTVDWDRLFAQLNSISFDGTFCVEFPVREERQPFGACVEEIRSLWGNAGTESNSGVRGNE